MTKWGDTGTDGGRRASNFMEYFKGLFVDLLPAWAFAFRATKLKCVAVAGVALFSKPDLTDF